MSSLDTNTQQTTLPPDELAALPPADARANLITISAAHAVLHGVSILMPLIFPILHDQYGFSYTQIGLIGTVSGLAGGLLQLVFGYLSRSVPRKVLIGVGNLVVAVATFMTATAVTFLPWLGWSSLRGIGGAPQHPAGNSILADSYGARRRGFAIAGHVAGGNVGTLLVPFIGAALIKAFGWQPTLMIFALPGLAAGSAVLLLTREPARPTMKPAVKSADRRLGERIASLMAPLRHRGVMLVILASLVAAGGRGLGILTKYLPLYLLGPIKLPQTTVTILYTLLLAGSIVGPLLAGRVSDRAGRRPLLLVSYGLATVFTLLVPIVFGGGAPLIIMVIAITGLGLVVYCESPLLQTYLVDNSAPDQRDVAMGWYFTLAFGIGSLWDVILGSVIDRTGSFIPAFLLMAASYVAAATVLLFIPRDQRR
ncbi:MAG TPA: MFS transporter [Ktedonobacterales bacterium]|nr:MFS transporter [Ktedonobacterales bacterium]